MAIEWSESIEGVDWNELQAMYQAAPLGNKDAAMLRTVFTNSLYRCFVYEDGKLVGAAGCWATAPTRPTCATWRSCRATRAPGWGRSWWRG